MRHTWSRYGGYDCSTKGDKRFSAFCAYLPGGRSIEQIYQCDVKGYAPGKCSWWLGKGKPPLDPNVNLWEAYLDLWRQWAVAHPELMDELRQHPVLSDRFATTPINQARALSVLLNEQESVS